MFWLRTLRTTPPGSFYFNQDGKTFGPGPSPQDVAAAISDYRKGNKIPNSGVQQCFEELIAFTCARLNNDPDFVYQVDAVPLSINQPASGGGCVGCGAQV